MIILAEDSPDERLALRLALEQASFSVREANNGAEALALQRDRPCAVLITDLFMPETDGFELLEAFRRDFPATKVIAISGRSGEYLESARLLGVHTTIRKPVDVEDLLRTVRALMPS